MDIKIEKSLPLGSLSAFMNLSIYLYLIGHNRHKLKVNPYKVFHISTSKIFMQKIVLSPHLCIVQAIFVMIMSNYGKCKLGEAVIANCVVVQ